MNQPIPFGRYTLLERLAAGQVADIFRASTVLADGQQLIVVIKRFRDELSADTDFAGSFIDEAKITSTLSHPNIAKVYEWSRQDGALFIAMEYIEGTNLASLLQQCAQKQVALPLPLVLLVTQEILAALEYAHDLKDAYGHSLGIVHRAVNPQNIVIATTGAVKLVDFGMARASSRVQATHPGMFTAPQAYTAPETMRQQALDGRADLYSIGILLDEMLGGAAAQAGGSSVGPKLPGVSPPAALAGLVMRLVSADPGGRPATAGAVRSEILSIVNDLGLSLEPAALSGFMQQIVRTNAGGVASGGFAFGEATSHWFSEGEAIVRADDSAMATAAAATPAGAAVSADSVPGRYEPPGGGGFAAGSTVMAVEAGGLSKKRHLKTLAIVLGGLVVVGLLVALVIGSLSKDPQPEKKVAVPPVQEEGGFAGPVQVKSDPEGALIFVDGDPMKLVGNPPRLLNLRAGTRRFKLLAPGYLPWEGDVALEKGQPREIVQQLTERKGTLVIRSKPPKAILYLDGKKVGRTPQTLPNLSAARSHKLVLQLRKHSPLKFEIDPSDWPEEVDAEFVVEKAMPSKAKPKKKRRRR